MLIPGSGLRRIALTSQYARLRHRGQARNSDPSLPYYSHLELTSWIVWKYGNLSGRDQILGRQAALLHDVREDTRATTFELILLFGYEMADAVQALSHSRQLKQLGATKRELMEEKYMRLREQPLWARTVEPCGRLANILEPGDWSPQELSEYVRNSIDGYLMLEVDAPKLYTRLHQELNAAHDKIETLERYVR